MRYRFNADEWDRLTKQERVQRCRLMAVEAKKLADESDGAMKVTYLTLERDWEMLALEIEQSST